MSFRATGPSIYRVKSDHPSNVGLYRLRKKSILGIVFVLQIGIVFVLKGCGFSRAVDAIVTDAALAAEGM